MSLFAISQESPLLSKFMYRYPVCSACTEVDRQKIRKSPAFTLTANAPYIVQCTSPAPKLQNSIYKPNHQSPNLRASVANPVSTFLKSGPWLRSRRSRATRSVAYFNSHILKFLSRVVSLPKRAADSLQRTWKKILACMCSPRCQPVRV